MEGVRLYGITGGRLCVAPVTEKSGAKIRLAFPDGEAYPFLRRSHTIEERMSYHKSYVVYGCVYIQPYTMYWN